MAEPRRQGAARAHGAADARGKLVLSPSFSPRPAPAPRSSRARGVGPGQRVAIALPAGLAFAQALHACLLLGAVAVPLDPRSLARPNARIARATARRCSWSAPAAPLPAPRRERSACRRRRSRHDLDATAVVIHTSGTTASPRPVELTYGNFLWSALGSAVALGSDPEERWLCALPLAHVGGLSILMRSAIYATTAVVHERFDTERVLHALREQDITLVSLVATTLARLLDAGLARPPALRCALTGGGPVPDALVARARAAGVPVASTYGLTEACSQVTTTPVAAIERRGSRRRHAAVLHARAHRAPTRRSWCGGRPWRRRRSRPTGGCTPAISGSLDGDGRLTVTGRKADTIVSGGENVAPAEVEAVLEAHPDVLEAAVLGRADRAVGRGGHGDRRGPAGRRRRGRGAARPLRARAGPLQGSEADRARARAARAHAGRASSLRTELR